MLGSLMMLASAEWVSSPSSANASGTRWSCGKRSPKAARIRVAREMSLVITSMPAVAQNASTIGLSE